jgi:hypothetical protein
MMLKSMNLPANESLAVPTNINYDAKFCYANINYDAKFCYANILIKICTKSLTT